MTSTTLTPQLRAELHDAVLGAARDIAALLGPQTDPAVPIPGAEWNVGEAAAHLLLANQLMADIAAGTEHPYGDGTPGGIAAANAASLELFTERTPTVMAQGIVTHATAFVEAAAERPGETATLTPMGPMDLDTFGSYLLTHMLGHGWDLARALRRPHMVDRHRVELCLPFLLTAMPRVVDRGAAKDLTAAYTLGLRGLDRRWTAAFTEGELTVTEGRAPGGGDCTIVTEPVTFFLIALGRCSPWSAIARGKILSWGRKPWLGPVFPRCFRAP